MKIQHCIVMMIIVLSSLAVSFAVFDLQEIGRADPNADDLPIAFTKQYVACSGKIYSLQNGNEVNSKAYAYLKRKVADVRKEEGNNACGDAGDYLLEAARLHGRSFIPVSSDKNAENPIAPMFMNYVFLDPASDLLKFRYKDLWVIYTSDTYMKARPIEEVYRSAKNAASGHMWDSYVNTSVVDDHFQKGNDGVAIADVDRLPLNKTWLLPARGPSYGGKTFEYRFVGDYLVFFSPDKIKLFIPNGTEYKNAVEIKKTEDWTPLTWNIISCDDTALLFYEKSANKYYTINRKRPEITTVELDSYYFGKAYTAKTKRSTTIRKTIYRNGLLIAYEEKRQIINKAGDEVNKLDIRVYNPRVNKVYPPIHFEYVIRLPAEENRAVYRIFTVGERTYLACIIDNKSDSQKAYNVINIYEFDGKTMNTLDGTTFPSEIYNDESLIRETIRYRLGGIGDLPKFPAIVAAPYAVVYDKEKKLFTGYDLRGAARKLWELHLPQSAIAPREPDTVILMQPY